MTSRSADPRDWSDEIRLTERSFDLRTAPVARGFFLGDYAGLAAAGHEFVAVFSTSSSDDPANVVSRRFKRGRQARGHQKRDGMIDIAPAF